MKLLWIWIICLLVTVDGKQSKGQDRMIGLAMAADMLSPMPDGLLIRQDNDLRHQYGQWSTIVVFEAPESDLRFHQLLNRLRRTLHQYIQGINGTAHHLWIQRWMNLRALTNFVHPTSTDPLSEEIHFERKRRGLIDGGGWLLSKLFGVATEAELKKVYDLIEFNRQQDARIMHSVN